MSFGWHVFSTEHSNDIAPNKIDFESRGRAPVPLKGCARDVNSTNDRVPIDRTTTNRQRRLHLHLAHYHRVLRRALTNSR